MDFLEALKNNGFEEQAHTLEKQKQNSIRIFTETADEKDFALGESKIGGKPHLPKDFKWFRYNDKPLIFLAQINLKEIAEFDTENKLPKKGLLYFFHEGGEETWGLDPKDKGSFIVHYIVNTVSELEVTEFPRDLESYLQYLPCKLSFKSETTYICADPLYMDLLNLHDDDVFDTFNNIYEEIYSDNSCTNRILGHPELLQESIFLDSQLVTNGLYLGDSSGFNDPRAKELESGVKDWLLLFQIDSDENAEMMWGDVGRIYFTIKKDDLMNQDFSNIWAVFQCL